MRKPIIQRRGFSAILAMMYLALFSMLAVGFYAASNSASIVSHNENAAARSMLAAETGMNFMHFHLAQVNIPHGTSQENLLNALCLELKAQLEDTGNLGSSVIINDGQSIQIPSIKYHSDGSSFRCTIVRTGSQMLVKVLGTHATTSASRAVQMQFDIQQHTSPVMNYGVASKSAVRLNSNAMINGSTPGLGSVLVASNVSPALFMDSNAKIAGDVWFTDTTPAYSLTSGITVAGLTPGDPSFNAHLHPDVAAPEFPTIDTAPFALYAGNPVYGGTIIPPAPAGGELKYDIGTLRNIRIRANPNPSSRVVFASDLKIDGVVYIEAPNNVIFDGNVIIRGAVVVQNNPMGTYTNNRISFNSNAKIQPIESLPDSDPRFPIGLQSLRGSAVLAPSFSVSFNSNFGTTGGSIVADKITFDSNALGSVNGNVICLKDTTIDLNGNAAITIQSHGYASPPAGIYFSKRYSAIAITYEEVKP